MVVVLAVPEVVVAVVPDVDVAVVIVVAVLDVSVIVPPGIAEVDVEPVVPVVSVAIVPVVIEVSVVEAVVVAEVSTAAAAVSVLLLVVSLLQANPKTLRATTVRRTRSFLLILFFSSRYCCVALKFLKLGLDLKKSACSPPLAID